MIDPNRMSDEERQVLEEVAKAKGQTLEEALIDLGHAITPAQDKPVSLEGQSQPEPMLAPVMVEEPIDVTTNDDATEADDLTIEVTPDMEPPPPPAAEDDEPEKEDEPEADNESFGTIKQICVQCGWDQDVPTIPEPEHKDKISFLQSVLGHKVFSKRYSMFGGNLRVTFRSLTVREIDTLYQEAFRAQKDGLIATAADYYEYLNRLRLYLQLQGFSAQTTSLHIKLPEGLSEDTHQGAASYWEPFLTKAGKFKEEVPLIKQIEDYVVEEVLKTEHLQRTITHECSKFNRLAAKLEAAVDTPDFWKETEQPS